MQEILDARNAIAEIDTVRAENTQLKAELAVKKNNKLAQAKFNPTLVQGLDDVPFMNQGRNLIAGYSNVTNGRKRTYHATLPIVRWFYENDPIAGTVVNRMADMSITTIRNRRKTKINSKDVEDNVMAFYDALVDRIRPFLKMAALEYLVHGMAVPDYTTIKLRGDKISEKLGRVRYTTIDQVWCRNPENIVLKKRPTGMDRQVFFKVPNEEAAFINGKGTRTDGTKDIDAYNYLVSNFPEYVMTVQNGTTLIPLDTVFPIYRNITSYEDYPQPFLVNALRSLQHKEYLKSMDRSIASRAIEAIRHIKIGDKDYPADQEDIEATENQVTQSSSTGERIFNLFTNHTVDILWVFPPLDALLNEAKYAEPNSDIFLGLGFPRILTIGETAKSNAADNKIALLGPKATLDDMRDAITTWLKKLYADLAEINGFTRIPEPYFAPIASTDMTALIQFAIDAMTAGAISKDTVAALYHSDYETEAGQIESEIALGVPSPAEQLVKQSQDFQVKQADIAHKQSLETIAATPTPIAGNDPKAKK